MQKVCALFNYVSGHPKMTIYLSVAVEWALEHDKIEVINVLKPLLYCSHNF